MEQSVVDLLKKVRRIEIRAKRSVNDLFAGQYRSAFRGQGMEFNEVREYMPGDDIRSIDWNVTARAGRPFIKRFIEERELSVFFLFDISASNRFGSVRSKWETALEIGATLMFSALQNNDKVGMLTFGENIIDYFPPKKGRSQILHLLRQLVAVEPISQKTNINDALSYFNKVQKRHCIVFLISDFQAELDEHLFALTQKKHDLIAVRIEDSRESNLPNLGLLTLEDPETGEIVELDTRKKKVRDWLFEHGRLRTEYIENCLKKSKTDTLRIEADQNYVSDLRRFFQMRGKRF